MIHSSEDYDPYASPSFEEGHVSDNLGRLEELLEEGSIFDVWYRESGSRIGDREIELEEINAMDAVNHLLSRAGDFDRYMASWDNTGNLSKIRVYENERGGLLGRLLPKRGDEIVFEYRAD